MWNRIAFRALLKFSSERCISVGRTVSQNSERCMRACEHFVCFSFGGPVVACRTNGANNLSNTRTHYTSCQFCWCICRTCIVTTLLLAPPDFFDVCCTINTILFPIFKYTWLLVRKNALFSCKLNSQWFLLLASAIFFFHSAFIRCFTYGRIIFRIFFAVVILTAFVYIADCFFSFIFIVLRWRLTNRMQNYLFLLFEHIFLTFAQRASRKNEKIIFSFCFNNNHHEHHIKRKTFVVYMSIIGSHHRFFFAHQHFSVLKNGKYLMKCWIIYMCKTITFVRLLRTHWIANWINIYFDDWIQNHFCEINGLRNNLNEIARFLIKKNNYDTP